MIAYLNKKKVEDKILWKKLKNELGVDLHVKTLVMLQNVMLAQAQYVQYSNI
jgi:hypothetical protein